MEKPAFLLKCVNVNRQEIFSDFQLSIKCLTEFECLQEKFYNDH